MQITVMEQPLGDFVRGAWNYALEPEEFRSNWHILHDRMIDHLTAVIDLDPEITKGPLIFTIPPRHMKSMTAAVFLPAYIWAQNPNPGDVGHGFGVRPNRLRGPGIRIAYASYGQDVSNDTSKRCNALVNRDHRCSRSRVVDRLGK
jgi:hypothetical protein